MTAHGKGCCFVLCLLLALGCKSAKTDKTYKDTPESADGRVILDHQEDPERSPLNQNDPLDPGTTAQDPFEPGPIDSDPDPDSSAGTQDCYKADSEICAIELAIVRQTNALRGRPFAHSAKISYVSRLWSRQMAAMRSIGHAGFPGQRNRDYRGEFGISARLSAENVAMSGGRAGNAESIAQTFVNMWANSAGHRRNMLGNYAKIGVGVARSGNTFYATQIFGSDR